MKRILIAILMVLILSNIAYAAKPNIGADQLRLDSGLIDTDGSLKVYTKAEVDTLAGGSSNITAIAGENITANDIVKIINDGGPKAYKFLTGVPSGNPPDISSYGTASVFESANSAYISATALSATKFVVCYRDLGNSGYGTARVGMVDGSNNLTWGTVSVFKSAASNYISATALSDTKFVVCYRDNGNSDYGTAMVGITNETTYTGILLPAFSDSAVTAASSGTFKILKANSVITNATLSLTALTNYYLDSNSALSADTNENYYVGIGLSTTEILIDSSYPTQTASSTIPVALQRK
jgi:hypothetical protein